MATTFPTDPPRLHWPFGLMIFAAVLAGVLIAILMVQGSKPGNQAPAPGAPERTAPTTPPSPT